MERPDVPEVQFSAFKHMNSSQIRDLPACILTVEGEPAGYYIYLPPELKQANELATLAAQVSLLIKKLRTEKEQAEAETAKEEVAV
jgi:hypothetical protein